MKHTLIKGPYISVAQIWNKADKTIYEPSQAFPFKLRPKSQFFYHSLCQNFFCFEARKFSFWILIDTVPSPSRPKSCDNQRTFTINFYQKCEIKIQPLERERERESVCIWKRERECVFVKKREMCMCMIFFAHYLSKVTQRHSPSQRNTI